MSSYLPNENVFFRQEGSFLLFEKYLFSQINLTKELMRPHLAKLNTWSQEMSFMSGL